MPKETENYFCGFIQVIFWDLYSSDAQHSTNLGTSGTTQHHCRLQLQRGIWEFSSAVMAQVPEQLSSHLDAPQTFQPGFLRKHNLLAE